MITAAGNIRKTHEGISSRAYATGRKGERGAGQNVLTVPGVRWMREETMKEWLRKAWRWFNLLDVPTTATMSKMKCDSCEDRATIFRSYNINGNAHNTQYCVKHDRV